VIGTGEASFARFRANLQARIGNLVALLEMLEFLPSDPEAIRQVQGELHTFKGEARLLGMVALSELTHALESLVGQEGGTDFPKLGAALEAMRAALDAEADARNVEARARRAANDLLGLEVGMAAEPLPENGAAGNGGARTSRATEQRWVQVDAAQIDALCEQMGELTASFGRLQSDMRALARTALPEQGRVAESLTVCRARLDDAVERAWGLRLAPIEPMLQKLEQYARVLAKRAGKRLEVRVDAGPVRLERDVVDQVWDSLLHLVQNAVAHGVAEPNGGSEGRAGTLLLSAASSGADVLLTVADDGDGIDPVRLREVAVARGIVSEEEARSLRDEEAVQLVFRPGFSTRDDVGHLAGRGVGLDVVKAKTEALGGSVRIFSQRGRGTRVVLTVPHAITKERVLIVEVDAALHGIPCRLVRGVLGEHDADSRPNGGNAIRFGGQLVPVRSVSRALGSTRELEEPITLVLQLGDKTFAARVSRIVGEQDLLRRPADPLLSGAFGIGASAHLDDGRLVLLWDLAYLERTLGKSREIPLAAEPERAPKARSRVLVVDDSPVVTSLVSELLSSVGLVVEVARDGRQALVAIDREVPSLVLSDLEMPNMGGFELLHAIRTRSQDLPVVMLTTRGSTEDRQRAASLGASAYVLKSGFQSDVLLDVVSRFVPVTR
jgi:chemotaxis protein histidine kinase CheA